MHRVVTNAAPGLGPDHKNHNTLDNRNMQNMRSRFGKSSKGYRGVRLFEGKWWRAQISVNQKPVHLGTFKTAEDAARAYDKANREYRGKNARLNFPD